VARTPWPGVAEAAQENPREADQRMRRAAVGRRMWLRACDAEISPFLQRTGLCAFSARGHHLAHCAGRTFSRSSGDVVIGYWPRAEMIAGTPTARRHGLKLALEAVATRVRAPGQDYGGLMVDVRPPRPWLAACHWVVTRLTNLSEMRRQADQEGGRPGKVALVMHHSTRERCAPRELLIRHKEHCASDHR